MKAILIMDMPEYCMCCKYLNSDTGECYATGVEDICITSWIEENKPDWCPLKPIPRKLEREIVKEDYNGGYSHGIVHGYNACIDEILGDKE